MSEFGELRHEVVREDGTGLPLLHVYLPEGLPISDLELTMGSSTDVAEVAIEHVATARVIRLIQVPGYRVAQDDSVVKYSKKHRRYTIRLSEAVATAFADSELPAAPANASDAPLKAKSPPVSPTKTRELPTSSAPLAGMPPPVSAVTGNIFGVLDNDDVTDDDAEGGGAEGAAGAAKKKKKKKKKGKKAGADAGGEAPGDGEAQEEPTANGNHASSAPGAGPAAAVSSGDENDATAAGGEGAAGAAKKKKKKKKKGGAAAAATECGTEIGGAAAEVEAEEEERPSRSSPPPPTPPPEPSSSAPNSVPASMPSSAPPSAPISKYASRALSVDLVADFLEDAFGQFEVGAAVEHDPLLGPAVHNGMGKVAVKGEDKCLEAPTNSWFVKELEGAVTPVSAFGVFDGHGGRQAAQHAAKNLLPLVARFAERALGPDVPVSEEQLAAEGYLGNTEGGEGEGKEDEEAAVRRAKVAAAQDALIARLPKALHASFVQCDEDVISRYKSSGTTATLAVQVGWELLVANVGDSLAYLDTGSEIVVISANHRVAESTDEQERITKAGGRIKPAKYGEDEDPTDGTPISATPHEGQQLRVWPGGINMTRTIGDESAKGLLIPEPAIRQISLPVTGARLIIASDGLWDAVNAKTVIGQLRTCNAREAASKAAVFAMRNKKHDDDVTVVVADFVPRRGDTHVPGLLKRAAGPTAAAQAALAAAGMREERAAQSWRPLETPSESWRERHRAHRRRAAAFLEQLALAERAEVEAAEELERQRRMTVAPAAGTAGVGTAVRPPPVSDTYRQLAELRVDIDTLLDEPTADADDDWKQVELKKKKDGGGGYDLRRELMKAARPAEGGRQVARSPTGGPNPSGAERPEAAAAAGGGGGGGGPRRERRDRGGREERDRERRGPPRGRERDGAAEAALADAAPPAPAGDASAEALAAQVPEQQPAAQEPPPPQQQQGLPPRGERRERGARAGRGGRGREGPGGRVGVAAVRTDGQGDAAAGAAATASAAAGPAGGPAPSGIVKAAGYLYVPKSMLTGGGAAGTAAAPPAAPVSGDVIAGDIAGGRGGKPRRDRAPRKSRREGGAAPYGSEDAEEYVPEPAAAETAPPEDGAQPMTGGGGGRRNQPRRKPGERREAGSAAAAAAATAAIGGLSGAPTGRPAPVGPPGLAPHPPPAHQGGPLHAPATSSDPVVVLESAGGHPQRRPQQQQQQHAYAAPPRGAAPYSAPQDASAAAAAGAAHHGRASHPQQYGGGGGAGGGGGHTAAAAATAQHATAPPARQPQAQPQPAQARQQSYQQPPLHHPVGTTAAAHPQPQQQQPRPAPAAAAAAVPAVPTYAGPLDFGAGFGPGAGMWQPGAGAAYGGFSANGGGPQQRSPSDVAAAAQAAAAAAVARKAAAAARSGGGGGGAPGGYAQGRS